MAKRIEALEKEVKELRSLIRTSHQQQTDALQRTTKDIATVVSRGIKPPLRG